MIVDERLLVALADVYIRQLEVWLDVLEDPAADRTGLTNELFLRTDELIAAFQTAAEAMQRVRDLLALRAESSPSGSEPV